MYTEKGFVADQYPTTHVNTIQNKSNKGIKYVYNTKTVMKGDGGREMQNKRYILERCRGNLTGSYREALCGYNYLPNMRTGITRQHKLKLLAYIAVVCYVSCCLVYTH